MLMGNSPTKTDDAVDRKTDVSAATDDAVERLTDVSAATDVSVENLRHRSSRIQAFFSRNLRHRCHCGH